MDREYEFDVVTDEEVLAAAKRAEEKWAEALRILAEMRATDPRE